MKKLQKGCFIFITFIEKSITYYVWFTLNCVRKMIVSFNDFIRLFVETALLLNRLFVGE